MTEGAFLYLFRCADGSYYVGTTRTSLEMRIAQHNAGSSEAIRLRDGRSRSYTHSGSIGSRTQLRTNES
jgi:predicted GIY-YIG superfamily endonuclease